MVHDLLGEFQTSSPFAFRQQCEDRAPSTLRSFRAQLRKPSLNDFGWAESAREGPADVECRRTRPVPILEDLSATGRMAPIAPSNGACQFKTPAGNPSGSYRCSCSSFQQGAFERRRRLIESQSHASTDSKYLA